MINLFNNNKLIILAKIKFDLRDPDEVFFSQREIDSLLNTKTTFIKTIASLIKESPFNLLDDEVIHLINRLVYMGEGQGFLAKITPIDIVSIIKKATFFREIYILFETNNDIELLNTLKYIGIAIDQQQLQHSQISPNPYTQIFIKQLENNTKVITLRLIPFHTLFEYATEVKKLPAVVFRPKNSENWKEYFNEKENGIKKGINELIEHLKVGHYRSPHFGLGKNHIGDYIDWASTDLRKPFLHYLHKYKGKGDPRISRALINLLNVKEGDTILDPFAGSGTFIADGPTMGINVIGIEVLNIGKIISEVKCNLTINTESIRNAIISIFEALEDSLFKQDIKDDLTYLKKKIRENLNDSTVSKIEPHLSKIIFLKKEIENIKDSDVKKLLLILLSQLVVEYSEKKRNWDFISSFKAYIEDRYLTLYATQTMAQILEMDLSRSKVKIIKGDSTNMSMINNSAIDGIITSPPYFDALDYISNNKASILILGLDEDLQWQSTKNFYEAKHRDEHKYEAQPQFFSDKYFTIELPESSQKLIELLKNSQRIIKSNIVENYLKMMKLSFEECYRVLKKDKYYLMVISKYHKWVINGQEKVIETSSILSDLGKAVGFRLNDIIEHGLSKADKGKIAIEDILIFQK
ncbi:MAG: hypothetical protein ABIK31_04450 [candidate division WOR-3 bacterium]